MSQDAPDSLRARGQILPMVVVGLIVLMTLGNAAANMMPVHVPTAAEVRVEEQQAIVGERRMRIAELTAAPDRCQPAVSHELVRLLVQDGQFPLAQAYADGYEARCGDDPVVHHWGYAPRPRR